MEEGGEGVALSPEIEIVEDHIGEKIATSRTYKLDFEAGRLTGELIHGLEAIKQFIFVSLRTPRFSYAIYSSDTGSEIADLLADEEVTIDYKRAELPRLITEALHDERIQSVDDFKIEHIADAFHIHFKVTTNEGIIEIEEVL